MSTHAPEFHRFESPEGDAFEDPLMRLIALVVLVVALISAMGLGVVYWGDSYARPAWSEHSVPPAMEH